jgi:hypothetical protein
MRTGQYPKGKKYGDERTTPFTLPKYEPKPRVPTPTIEGVPPIGKPREDSTRT